MSRSGVLGYHSGSGLLLFVGVALKAQTGSRFSLFLEGEIYRRDSGFLMPLAARDPGETTLLMKNPPPPPPPERSARAALLPSLDSGISGPCKTHAAEERHIGEMRTQQTHQRVEKGGRRRVAVPGDAVEGVGAAAGGELGPEMAARPGGCEIGSKRRTPWTALTDLAAARRAALPPPATK
nr:unnamed protein product [Digitaria exilis]